eukprot:12925890-Alexandrium_andersonii.AAC.1
MCVHSPVAGACFRACIGARTSRQGGFGAILSAPGKRSGRTVWLVRVGCCYVSRCASIQSDPPAADRTLRWIVVSICCGWPSRRNVFTNVNREAGSFPWARLV